MNFPRYPAYKPSGVEWLGEVPEHWDVTALKHGYVVTLGKMLQPEAASERDMLLPYLRAANIRWSGVDDSDIKTMWFSARDREHLLLLVGDLLVSEGGDVGRSALWKGEIGECYFQNSVNRVRPSNGNLTSFLRYWMSTMKDKGFIDVLCNKSTIAHFTAEKVGAVPVPLPPFVEQQSIATFLDHETTKIDALIAEQHRLIELLQEKRQAVISHAVTKGLNPDAPMKDSGVEWLGEVPEHWKVVKLGHLLAESPKNGLSPEITPSGTTPTFSIAAVRGGRVDIESHLKYCDALTDRALSYFVSQGDILVLRGSGSKELVGTAGVVVEPPPTNCIYPDILIRIRPSALITSWYLVQTLNCTAIRPQVVVAAQTAAGIWKLAGGDLCEIKFPCPPLGEMLELEENTIAKMEAIDDLIANTEASLSLLQERRSALISVAVTGQIDVRGLAEVGVGEQ